MQFNCLVDNARIDKKIVARNLQVSEQQLLIQNGNQYQIRGPFDAVYYLPSADNWQIKNGSRATFSNEKKLRSTIGVDKSAAIEDARRDEARLNEELKAKKAEEVKLQHDHTRYQ